MKAVRLHELQGPDELVYEDVPEPEPGPGETVVRLRAAALNRRDLFATQGQYPGVTPDILPIIPGSDGAGEVVARGEGAEGPDEGTEVVLNPALYWGDDPRVPGKEYRILGIPRRRHLRPVHQGAVGSCFPQALTSFARGGSGAAARCPYRLQGASDARRGR